MSGTYRYVRASGIRSLVKENQKRCGRDFLHALDIFVYETVLKCIKQWNGHKSTLDSTVANFILRKEK